MSQKKMIMPDQAYRLYYSVLPINYTFVSAENSGWDGRLKSQEGFFETFLWEVLGQAVRWDPRVGVPSMELWELTAGLVILKQWWV